MIKTESNQCHDDDRNKGNGKSDTNPSETFRTHNRFEEMITGEIEKPLDLPYTPIPEGAEVLRQRYLQGRDDAGARTWVFMNLDSSRKEDFLFSVLNTTYINADISVELFFEKRQKKIICFRIAGLRLGVSRVNCAVNAGEDATVFDAPDYLESKDIPENTPFAVRFISSIPVVISHRDHAPAYRSNVI